MKVDKALDTPGWMDPFELVWLAARATEHSTIVEIGSFLGRSTRALADNTPGVVYAVDDWIGPRDTVIDGKPESFAGRDLYKEFMANMEGVNGKLIPIKSDHKNIHFYAEPDMVFLDGSHTYDDVKHDIQFWYPRICHGGLLCGHDVDMAGVKQAVVELLPTSYVVLGTKIWMFDVP